MDKDDQLYDHLWQISANQDENNLGLNTLFQEENVYKTPVKVKKEILVHTPIVDMSEYNKPTEQMYTKIIDTLKQDKKIRLLNLTTPRATRISEDIKAKLTEAEKKSVVVEYSPKKGKKWNCQSSFSNKGIPAHRVDFHD